MEKDLVLKLNEVRKELEINEKDFIKIVSLATIRRNKSNIVISDEMLYEIILGAMTSYDYENTTNLDNKIKASEALRILLDDKNKEDYFSSNEIKEMFKEYQEINSFLQANNTNSLNNRKSLEEIVDHSIKSLGL